MGKKRKHQAIKEAKSALSSSHHDQGIKQQHKGNKRKILKGDKGQGQGAGALQVPKADIGQPKSEER